jgi:C-terminal processing protease CtpA/Prc
MMLDQTKGDIKSNYYDPTFHGANLDATFKEAAEKIKNAQSNGQILGIIAQAVLSLGDSHTFFIPPDRQARTDYGWEMQVIGDDVYVTKVKEKSDAEAKGLKVGDLVHLIDGYQPVRENAWKLVYLYYALRPQPGMRVTVSSPGGQPRELDILAKVTDRKRLDLTNYADYMDLVRESENEDSKRKKSHRLQEIGDLLIWKMPGFDLTADEVDGLMDKARAHKKLILDLRGNHGGYEETLLRMIGNLFDHDIKVGDIQRRKETKALIAKTRGDKGFKGQLIVLVDSISASSAEILARVVDGSRFDEYKARYGASVVTGWASIYGFPVGIVANARGVLFSEEAQKATEFILLANQMDTPLVFLQNTTGYMVGTEYEQRGMIKDGAKMINAVSNSTVPHITITIGASFGAGNYGMSGRAYDPRFVFAWPSAKLAVMGAAQLAGVLSIVGRQAAMATGRPFDEEADQRRRAAIETQIEAESHSFFVTARLYDDGIIDPRDTRTVLGLALSAVHSQVVEGRRGYGVFRM